MDISDALNPIVLERFDINGKSMTIQNGIMYFTTANFLQGLRLNSGLLTGITPSISTDSKIYTIKIKAFDNDECVDIKFFQVVVQASSTVTLTSTQSITRTKNSTINVVQPIKPLLS